MPEPMNDDSTRKNPYIRAILYGSLTAVLWGTLFGLLSLVTIILGIIGSFGTGFVVAAAVTAPFARLSRRQAWTLFPLSWLLSMLSIVWLILPPFLVVIFQKDPDAGISTAISLALLFYLVTLGGLGSSLIITIVGLVGSTIGFPGRLRGLRLKGVYVPDSNKQKWEENRLL